MQSKDTHIKQFLILKILDSKYIHVFKSNECKQQEIYNGIKLQTMHGMYITRICKFITCTRSQETPNKFIIIIFFFFWNSFCQILLAKVRCAKKADEKLFIRYNIIRLIL